MIESSNNPPGERRTTKVVARVSRDELSQLKLAAEAANRTTGRWAREVLLEASLPELPFEYDSAPGPAPAWAAEMLDQLRRVGNNLNQVAAQLNRRKGAPVDVGEVTDAVTSTEEVLAQVLEHLEQYEEVNRGEIDEPKVKEYVPTGDAIQDNLYRIAAEVAAEVEQREVEKLKAKIRKHKGEQS